MTSMKKQQVIVYFSSYLNDVLPVVSSIKAYLYDILDVKPKTTPLQQTHRDLPSIVGNCKRTLDDLKRIQTLLKGYFKAMFVKQDYRSRRKINSTQTKRNCNIRTDNYPNHTHWLGKCLIEACQKQIITQYNADSSQPQPIESQQQQRPVFQQQQPVNNGSNVKQQKNQNYIQHSTKQSWNCQQPTEPLKYKNMNEIPKKHEVKSQNQKQHQQHQQHKQHQQHQQSNQQQQIETKSKLKSNVQTMQIDTMINRQTSNMFQIRHRNMECLTLIKGLRNDMFRSRSVSAH